MLDAHQQMTKQANTVMHLAAKERERQMGINRRADMGLTFSERYVYMFVLGIFSARKFFFIVSYLIFKMVFISSFI